MRQSALTFHPQRRSPTMLIADVLVTIAASTANRYLKCMINIDFVMKYVRVISEVEAVDLGETYALQIKKNEGKG